MTKFLDKTLTLAKCVIFLAHIKDKLVNVELEEGGDTDSKSINLTGKLPRIFCERVDTIGYLTKNDGVLKVTFTNNDGSRCSYLADKTITLVEKKPDDKLVSYWKKEIFID
jgi:hypothetical protein